MAIDRTIGTASVEIKADASKLRADLAGVKTEVAAAGATAGSAFGDKASAGVDKATNSVKKLRSETKFTVGEFRTIVGQITAAVTGSVALAAAAVNYRRTIYSIKQTMDGLFNVAKRDAEDLGTTARNFQEALDKLKITSLQAELANLEQGTQAYYEKSQQLQAINHRKAVEDAKKLEQAEKARLEAIGLKGEELESRLSLFRTQAEKELDTIKRENSRKLDEENRKASEKEYADKREQAYQLFVEGLEYDTERAENQKKLNEEIAEERKKHEAEIAKIQEEAARRMAAQLQPVLDSFQSLFGQSGTDRIGVSAKFLASRIDALIRTTNGIKQAQAGLAQGVVGGI